MIRNNGNSSRITQRRSASRQTIGFFKNLTIITKLRPPDGSHAGKSQKREKKSK